MALLHTSAATSICHTHVWQATLMLAPFSGECTGPLSWTLDSGGRRVHTQGRSARAHEDPYLPEAYTFLRTCEDPGSLHRALKNWKLTTPYSSTFGIFSVISVVPYFCFCFCFCCDSPCSLHSSCLIIVPYCIVSSKCYVSFKLDRLTEQIANSK